MKKLSFLAALLFGTALLAADAPANSDVVFDLQEKDVTKTITLQKPADEAGKIPVLQFKAFFKTSRPSGWAPVVSYRINGKYITQKTAAGTPRLLRSQQSFVYGPKKVNQSFFKSNRWLTIYSKDGETTDVRLVKGGVTDAVSFSFDLTGMVPAAAGEVKLAVNNNLRINNTKTNMPLIIRNAQIVMMSKEEAAKLLGK